MPGRKWWIAERTERLLKLQAEGMSCADIATALHVSARAIRSKLVDLDLRGRVNRPPLWLPADIEKALHWHDVDQESYAEIGRRLGRTARMVQEKIARVHVQRRRAHLDAEMISTKVCIAPAILDEKNRRAEACDRRSLTSSLMGDPPPGYSALDVRGCA